MSKLSKLFKLSLYQHKLLSFALALLLLAACSKKSPEQQAAEAAVAYYQHLVEGYPEGFLEGKVGVDNLPSDYCDQLLAVYKQYIDELQKKHQGLQRVRIADNVGRRDTLQHLMYTFLLLSYGDSTQEEITVPMVEVDGEWKMK